ncbi:calcium-binding protein [Jannaschia formosa]|uniref:calcium-binding protein n=1 Tax=Jannaschia formosa TaxID=2259592 RepID=UPI000E1B75F7|nr:hypothetical protein [Jannaschia formosa]TFL16471.1 hypothetical protein DR046_19770 [Jannaschia formosa]
MAVFSEPPDFSDSAAGANTLRPGDTANGSFGTASDRDLFLLSAELGFDYFVSLVPRGDSLLSGYSFFSFDTENRFADGADETAEGASLVLTAADLGSFQPRGTEDRDFIITLEPFDGSAATGDYAVSVLREEDSTAATAVSLAPGESHDGAWQYRGDVDMIALEVQAGRSYAVTLDILDSFAQRELLTLNSRDFALRGPSDTAVRGAFVDNDGAATQRAISYLFEAEETGTYFLLAENDSREFDNLNFGAETGSYTVTLTEDEPADETSPLRLELGVPVIDRVDFIGDEDWWGVELQGGVTYDVFFGVQTEDGLSGSFVEIFDANGAEVAQIDSPRPPSFSDPIPPVDGTFTPDADGLYFFSGVRFAELGEYRLEVSAPPQTLTGSDEVEDVLNGAGGNDLIRGLALNDVLRGFGGNDTLDGGLGADRMEGGPGDDLFIVDDRGDTVVGGDGTDTVQTSVNFQIRRSGVERVEATGSDNVRLTGTGAGEELIGNGGSNILIGNGGSDILTGAGGDDFFVINGAGGTAPNLRVTDFEDGDKLAFDDQLVGLGRGRVDVRDLTADVAKGLLRDGIATYNGRTGEVRLDLDGDGPGGLQTVLTIEGGGRLGFDDILLF